VLGDLLSFIGDLSFADDLSLADALSFDDKLCFAVRSASTCAAVLLTISAPLFA
jgi:hypothetical protein